MNAGAMKKQRQVTLPLRVVEAAGLLPGDQVEWRFEDGEIHGRRLTPKRMTKEECLRAIDESPLRFETHWEGLREETR